MKAKTIRQKKSHVRKFKKGAIGKSTVGREAAAAHLKASKKSVVNSKSVRANGATPGRQSELGAVNQADAPARIELFGIHLVNVPGTAEEIEEGVAGWAQP